MAQNRSKYSWKSLAEVWADLKPPMRPSRGEILVYEKYLKQVTKKLGRKPKVLLFGATPELRDLFVHHKLAVTMVDINQEMVKAMDKLVRIQNPQEKLVYGDWINFRLKEKFDLAIGDHIYCNIPFKKFREFSANIKRHLNPAGFLIHSIVLKELKDKISLAEFLKKYRSSTALKNNRLEKWYWIFNLMFNSDIYQKSLRGPYWLSVGELWCQAWQKEIELSLQEAAEITDHIFIAKRCMYILPPRQEFETVFQKDFKIIASDHSREHPFYQCYRIYFARKK